jgi:hypothetical protein
MNVKLPWELKSVYLGALWDNGLIEDDEEDEEMTEARQDRLRVSHMFDNSGTLLKATLASR